MHSFVKSLLSISFIQKMANNDQTVPPSPATPTSPLSQYSLNFFHTGAITQQYEWPAAQRRSQRRRRLQAMYQQSFSTSLEDNNDTGGFRSTFIRTNGQQQSLLPFRPGTPPPSTPIRSLAMSYDPKRLAPPTVYELGLTRGEAPPHKRVSCKK